MEDKKDTDLAKTTIFDGVIDSSDTPIGTLNIERRELHMTPETSAAFIKIEEIKCKAIEIKAREETEQAKFSYKETEIAALEKTKQEKEVTSRSAHEVAKLTAKFIVAGVTGIFGMHYHIEPLYLIGIIGAFFSPEITKQITEAIGKNQLLDMAK